VARRPSGRCCSKAWARSRRADASASARKTGYRWRAERGGLPPLRLPEAERGDRYLSLVERKRIATLRERGHGVREIARRVGRAPSTISRGLRRNVAAHDHDRYDADLAHARTRARRLRPRRGRLVDDGQLRAIVQSRLERKRSSSVVLVFQFVAVPAPSQPRL
jgi:hypothetical protein